MVTRSTVHPFPSRFDNLLGLSAKNNDSLVLQLRYGDRGIMLPGDAETEAESAMLAESNKGELRSDVLKGRPP